MKIAVIVSVYKDRAALKAILAGLELQTLKDFDVIVSEDGRSDEMAAFFAELDSPLNVAHFTQDDTGWRKSRALNRVLCAISHDYILFIDGDCVPHPRFVQNHVALSSPSHFVAAKRVFMGPAYSQAIKAGKVPTTTLDNGYLLSHYRELRADPCSSLEDALYIPPKFFSVTGLPAVRMKSLIGCNFSCYRDALVRINGFDEAYVDPSVGEDDDLQWRLQATGVRLKSGRNMCIVYHMFHKKIFSDEVYIKNKQLMQRKIASGQFRCERGLDLHAPEPVPFHRPARAAAA